MFFLTIARDTGVGPKSKDLGLSINSLHIRWVTAHGVCLLLYALQLQQFVCYFDFGSYIN